MKKLFLLFFSLLCCLSLFAQKNTKGTGIVIDDEGRGIDNVKVTIDDFSVVTDIHGRFTHPQGGFANKPTNVAAIKQGYKFRFWLFDQGEVQIVMQPPILLLEGQVTDERLRPIQEVRVEVVGSGVSAVYTNKEGNFIIKLPYTVRITPNTKFAVDGYEITAEDFSYSASGNKNYVAVRRLTGQKLYVYKPTKIENRRPIKGVKVFYDGKTTTLEKELKLEIKAPNNPNDPLLITDPQVLSAEKAAENYIEIFIERQNDGKNASDSAGVSKNIIKGSLEDYQSQFDNLIVDIKFNNMRAVSNKVEQLAKQIKTENMDSIKREGLQKYLEHLELIFINMATENEEALEKTKATIQNIKYSVYQKDSLLVLEQEKLKQAEKEKAAIEAEFQRDLLIGGVIVLLLALLAFGAIQVAKRIRKQRNDLQNMNEQLEHTSAELLEKVVQVREQNIKMQAQSQELQQLNGEISQQNQKITDSIRYALTIQTAILPAGEMMKTHLNDFFVTYRSKDIVSGDFYWFSNIHETGEKMIVSVLDCTGHGVSGAFMSMIGNTLLNEIVNQKDIIQPDEILRQLDVGVRTALKQEQRINDDGMDVCLCLLEKIDDHQKTKITFAGAKRPLYYAEMPEKRVDILKGAPKSVGGGKINKRQTFSSQELILDKGDAIYLCSDGFIDQNSESQERLGTERFKALVSDIAHKSMLEQKEIFEKTLDKHQGKAEQRDDILLIGIRL